jgi:amidophosphoribosyltransferase
MVLGHKESDDTYIVTSESSAISAVGAILQRDVIPGELIKLSKTGLETEKFSDDQSRAHCSFEFTYFAHPSSNMEGKNIYISRKKIGQFLAKKFPLPDADLVIPVPDSARPAALGYAQELGISFDEGLLKDRYSKKGPLRSFIEPHQSDRVEINRWIIPIKEIIEGRHVVVIDDSLVRGTSSKAIIKALRRAGAKKISMLITYPQINYPCYAGIDFPSQDELATFTDGKELSNEAITEMVRQNIGADFLGYNDAENLANAVGIPKDSMCFTCSSGNYESLGIQPDFTKREQIKAK